MAEMKLAKAYKAIKDCIVAFAYVPFGEKEKPFEGFPKIFGTGFIIREDGIILTNDHVIQAMKALPRPAGTPDDHYPVKILVFRTTPEGQLVIPFTLTGFFTLLEEGSEFDNLPEKPDIAIAQINIKGLPAVKVDDSTYIEEGLEVATAGFPMGTDALTAPGWLTHVTPTLQRGIISSVLPFACQRPHGFTINVMVQGGASGSPVFLSDEPGVIGILYAALEEHKPTSKNDMVRNPTNISYVVPSRVIVAALKSLSNIDAAKPPEGTKTLDEDILERKRHFKPIRKT